MHTHSHLHMHIFAYNKYKNINIPDGIHLKTEKAWSIPSLPLQIPEYLDHACFGVEVGEGEEEGEQTPFQPLSEHHCSSC